MDDDDDPAVWWPRRAPATWSGASRSCARSTAWVKKRPSPWPTPPGCRDSSTVPVAADAADAALEEAGVHMEYTMSKKSEDVEAEEKTVEEEAVEIVGLWRRERGEG